MELNRFNTTQYWLERMTKCLEADIVTHLTYQLVIDATVADNIGFDQGQIRPGELSRWDLYYHLQYCGHTPAECLRATGLTESQVAAEESASVQGAILFRVMLIQPDLN